MILWKRVVPRFYLLLRRNMSTRSPSEFSKVMKVHNVENEEKMILMFEDHLNREHHLLRQKSEHLAAALKRIQLTMQKLQKKQSKKKLGASAGAGPSGVAMDDMEASLYDPSGELVPGDKSNNEAWMENSRLVIGEHCYTVRVNPPRVVFLKLSDCLLSGCPVVGKVELCHADVSQCKWAWFRQSMAAEANPATSSSSNIEPGVILGTSRTYWPSEEDVGHQLLLECTPVSPMGKLGEPVRCLAPSVIIQGPEDTPIHRRHLHTPWQLADTDKFRMVSYNTLAGVFTQEEYAKTVLYPYCDPDALAISYRECLLVQEVVGYNADIINLQEVTGSTFEKYLLPAFDDKGYSGLLQLKGGSVNEGEAIFYNRSKFNLVDVHSVVLSDFLANDPSCADLLQGLQEAPFLGQVLKKSAICLVSFLRSEDCTGRYVMVVNTHLYYHPRGDLIRLIQVEILLRYLRTRLDFYATTILSTSKIAVVFAGDLNACPCVAAYSYLATGSVSREHQDWMVYKMEDIPHCKCFIKNNCLEEREGGSTAVFPHIAKQMRQEEYKVDANVSQSEDNFAGLDLKHNFNFMNVTGTSNVTNFTAEFKCVLDYIFVDATHLAVDRIVPLPSLEELSEFVALPSVYFPSDHLALVADLKWR